MSDSRPPIFDDGGGLPDVDRSRRRTGPGSAPRRGSNIDVAPSARDSDDGDDWRGPNYLVRRAIVVGLVLAVITVAAFLVGRAISSEDSGSGSGFGSAEWNRVVTVDNSAGTVVISDAQGEETNRFRFGLSSLTDTEIIGSTLISVDADALGVVQLDANAEITIEDDVTTVEIASTGTLLRPSGSAQTVVAQNVSAGQLVMVHGPTGDVIDTSAVDTVPGARYDVAEARTEPDGRHVLVTDTGNFQSVLFSFDRDEPSFFPGLALAVNNDIVVTAVNVGTNANVAVFDHAGEPGVAAQTASVRAGMISGGKVILIGIDGEVLGLSLSSGDITELGSLSIGTVESGDVAVRGDRLIVVGALGTALIDTDGAIITELPGARPTTSGIDELAPHRTACLIVEREGAGEVAVVDLETGTVGVEALANPDVLATVDGCQPIVPTSAGYLSLTPEAVRSVILVGDVVAISPDGGTIGVEWANRLELFPRATSDTTDDDDEIEPVDVGRGSRDIFFANL
jgi:hypothetical protein